MPNQAKNLLERLSKHRDIFLFEYFKYPYP
jgi:hypothetical protein